MARVLLVDDEASVLRILSTLLKTKGHEIETASDGEAAIQILNKAAFDLMISDIRMSPMDGLTLLKHVQQNVKSMQTVMLTAYASVDSAVEALKLGAFDYVTKPFDITELLHTIDRALKYGETLKTSGQDVMPVDSDIAFHMENIVAESASMKEVCETIKRLAATDTLVSIVGETGTGKGLIAETLHRMSKRKDRDFVRVNCATIPEPLLESELFGHIKGAFPGAAAHKKGLFEQTHGGTIYLEEASCLPLEIQEKLFKALQERKIFRVGGTEPIAVSIRLIISSNVDIETLVQSGMFREDLFYRFNVVTIRTRPLRERAEDILPLFSLFVKRLLPANASMPSIDQRASTLLENYTWPGNVEELENAARHVLSNPAPIIGPDSLPPKIASMTTVAVRPASGKTIRAKSLMQYLRSKGASPGAAADTGTTP